MLRKFLFVAAVALALPSAANAAVYTVGIGAGCSFSDIQLAIDAAAANPGQDIIRITNQITWSNLNLSIGAQELIVEGGATDCASPPGASSTTLSGLGGAAAPVVTVTGAGLRVFRSLTIIQGDASGNGGGINFDGSGQVALVNTSVGSNFAGGNGGGISVRGTGGLATLSLGTGTVITSNVAAQSGGGVVLRSDTRLIADGVGVQFLNNRAGVFGGGLHISDQSAVAYIGSSGGPNGTFVGNEAEDGGAISINDGQLYAFGTAADRPFRIQNNRARNRGGAIFFDNGDAEVCLRSFYLNANQAQEGAAFHVGETGGSLPGNQIGLNANVFLNVCRADAFIAEVPCTRNANGCNLIENHVTQTAAGVATNGAAVRAFAESFLNIRDTTFGNNLGANVIRTTEVDTLTMQNSLIAANGSAASPLTGPLLRLNFGSSPGPEEFLFRNNTIARNTSSAPQVIQFEDGPDVLRFNHNLVWQPGQTLLTIPFAIANSANYNWDFNSGNAVSGLLPPPWNVSVTTPRFVDSNNNNFRLRVGSPLIDLYPVLTGSPVVGSDLDGRPRPRDIPLKIGGINAFSNADPGAYETQPTDDFILNGRFNADLNFWLTETPAGSVSWNPTDSGTAPGTGHAAVNVPPPAIGAPNLTRLTAFKYCFNVPGNGLYTVTARALQGSGINADTPVLRWRTRQNSENCTGPASAEGDVFFAGGAGWRDLAAPLEIPVNFSTSATATIELRLDVQQSSFALGSGLIGAFDNVIMTGTGLEDLFKDGFEDSGP